MIWVKSALNNGKRKERAKIELAFAKELTSLFRVWLSEILPEGTTEEDLTVEKALEKNQGFSPRLKDTLSKYLKRSALYGVEIGQDQVERLRGTGKDVALASDFELANEDVLLWLMGAPGTSGYADLLTSGMLGTNENQLRRHISEWISNGQPLSELVKTLRTTTFGKRRAEAIAATEVTRAFAKGNNLAWKRAGFIQKQRWQTSTDELVCPLCGPLAGTVVGIDDSFWDGQGSVFENGLPPRHSRCRCWVVPVVDEEAEFDQTPPKEVPELEFTPSDLDDFRERIKQELGYLGVDETLKNKMLQRVAELVSGPISINFPSKHISKLLKAKRFKTQFETNTSGGSLNQQYRATAELRGLGYPMDVDAEKRPIYGWFNQNDPTRSPAFQYGDLEFVLKPEARKRATFTLGDSLFGFDIGETKGAAVIDFDIEAFDHEVDKVRNMTTGDEDRTEFQRRFGYIEAQIQGGVSLDDVERVILRDSNYHQNKTSEKVVKELQALGIVVEDKRGQWTGRN